MFEFNNREQCVEGLSEYLDKTLFELGAPVAIEKLIQSTIVNSAGEESRFQDSFQFLHKEQRIVVTRADGKKRRISKHYRPDDIVRTVPRQRHFDFREK